LDSVKVSSLSQGTCSLCMVASIIIKIYIIYPVSVMPQG
jgi:hypothetical protein